MMLHPGALAALRRINGNELDIARMMAAGDISGPQDMGGFVMFCVRMTGTGLAYRAKTEDRDEEYVWRDASLYLTPDFLARCNGLPVIWEHPAGKPKLDHDEFHDRIIGTVFLPYIQGNEVWAVVKIWDDPAAALMRDSKLSTSPGVVIRVKPGHKQIMPGGADLLNEPIPALVDHLAVCEQGVWDKGGEPCGVEGDQPRHDAFETKLDGFLMDLKASEILRTVRWFEHRTLNKESA